MTKGLLLTLILFIFSITIGFAQINTAGGVSCDEAGPICADNSGSYVFQNNNDGSIDLGQIACLGNSPRPAWFFLKVDQSGDLQFQINQWQDFNGDGINNDGGGSGLDVDFVAWGPFSSEDPSNCNMLADRCSPPSPQGNASGCPDNTADTDYYINNEDNSNIIDCSYSPSPSETLTINNVNSGEYYILLITNWTGGDGLIEIVQTNFGDTGAGSSDCSIVNTDNYCEGEMIDLDATTLNAVSYEWFQDGVLLAETGPILANVVAPSAVYTVNALDNLGAIIFNYEFIVNFETQPLANAVSDMLQCDGDNNGLYLFNLESQTAQILGGLDPVEFPVTYHLNQADADANLNAITSPYENTANPQTIYARVENSKLTDCYDTTSFIIQVFDTPTANAVADQLICDDDNDDTWSFDLTSFDATVLDTQDPLQFSITYHLTQADADANLNALPSPYSNVGNPQVIYVRVENNDNVDCYDTTSFQLEVFDTPTANVVPDQLICDNDNNGFWSLDLNALSTTVLGTQNATDFTVTYHSSQADADTNSNAIASPYSNVTAYQEEEIFVRIENNLNTDCYDTSSFMFDVFDQPFANTVIYDLCDDIADGDDTNGFTTFGLGSITTQVLGVQDPLQFNVTYHVSQADADANVSALPLSYVNATADFQQILVRVENVDNTACYETALIDLVIYELPTVVPVVELFQCDDNADGFVNFNLTEANELISTDYLNETFTYHLTFADAENGVNAIVDPIAYTNTDPSAAPDVLFVRTETINGCHRVSQLELLVSTTALPNTFQLAYEVCDDTVIDGDDHNGIATFDFSDAEAQIRSLFPIGQALTITYYETLDDALAETNAIPDISNHRNDVSPNVQNIYVRIDSDIDNACLGLGHHITLTVNPVPEVIAVTDFIVCEDNTDGFYDFDLESKTSEVLNGQSPTLFNVTYHTTQADADTNTAALVSPYINAFNPQQIYVRITNTVTGCYKSVVNFSIEVQEEVQANQNMPIFNLCDEFGDNDGYAEFDLRSQDALVLDGQDPADYSVTYYLTQLDADLGVNPLTDLYENITNPQTIYARVDDTTITNSICWATTEIILQVNLLPIFDLDDEYLLCLDTNGTEVVDLPVLDTQLSESEYSFEWSLNGTVMTAETASSLMPSVGGTYSVIATNIITGCQNSDSTIVNESSPPVITAEVTSLIFAENHVIEVTATGLGVYEFSLDNGAWQDSNVFENVSAGVHLVIARDKNGCGLASVEVLVIDYPEFFTPNGDGYHDTWNIVGIETQPDAVVYIFDRFGKLLKQLSPTGTGWDGTFNGEILPSNDYWFTVEYNEPISGSRKQFRAHFALKR
jgi:gliding motility-associated-like protein